MGRIVVRSRAKMISLVRKPNPISRLPLQGPNDNYKDEGPIILLPLLDYMNWMSWTDTSKSGLIMAKITLIGTGHSILAMVGSADLEENTYGDIYMTQYLMDLLNIVSPSDLVRIEPFVEELSAGKKMVVSHDNELVVELGLNVFEKLQETIMDWPIIHKDGYINLLFPDAGDLIVTLTVTELEPADVVQLGGELALEINGPVAPSVVAPSVAAPSVVALSVPVAHQFEADEPHPDSVYIPKNTWTHAGNGNIIGSEKQAEPESIDERRRKVRESWLNKFSGAS
jgi:hypothetical protein